MVDLFGDGWNGSYVHVILNGQLASSFTLESGGEDTKKFSDEGNDIEIKYQSGSWDEEVMYFVLDSNESLLFEDGPPPQPGLVYDASLTCSPNGGGGNGGGGNGGGGNGGGGNASFDMEGSYTPELTIMNLITGNQMCTDVGTFEIDANGIGLGSATCLTNMGRLFDVNFTGVFNPSGSNQGEGMGYVTMTGPNNNTMNAAWEGECYEVGGQVVLHLEWEMQTQGPGGQPVMLFGEFSSL